jgi:hypothetical protein
MGLSIEIEDIDENGKPTIIITEKNHNMKPIKINPIIYKLLLDCNEVILNCNLDIINHLPDNIETIQLGEILYYEYKSIEKYPKNLKKIIMYGKFDKYLATLPMGLETLIIDTKIECDLNNLPPTIKHLELDSIDCNGTIEYPVGLKYLKLNTNNFEHVANLPPTLETFILIINSNDNRIFKTKITQPINYSRFSDNINSLPNNIKSLKLYFDIIPYRDIKINKLPDQLELLNIDYCHINYFNLTKLPETLNKITVNYMYNYGDDITITDFKTLFTSLKPDIEVVRCLNKY